MSDKTESKPSTMPPVASVDAQDTAMKLRKLTLKKLNELTPELRSWVVACLADDIAKANG
jgi:hypothetical protein